MSERTRRYVGALALLSLLTGLVHGPVYMLEACPLDAETRAGCCCCDEHVGNSGLAVASEPVSCCSVEAADPPAVPVPAVIAFTVDPQQGSAFVAIGSSPTKLIAASERDEAVAPDQLAHPPPFPPAFRLYCTLLI